VRQVVYLQRLTFSSSFSYFIAGGLHSLQVCGRQPKTYVKPEAAITVFWAPDDGWCVVRNMLSN